MINVAKTAGLLLNGMAFIAPKQAGRICLDLFCRPNEGRIFSEKELFFLKQAEWSILTLDSKKIQCYTWGSGSKKVLLAHGFNSNASRWRILVNLLLKNDFKVMAFDVPAHGHSEWKRVNGLLYARTVEKIMNHFKPHAVVGHSFAGIAYGYYFSKMEALPVEKIILMGVPDELTDISEVFFNTLGLNNRVRAAYYGAFKEKFNYATEYFTLSKLFKNVTYPSLIIHDENDDIASFEGAVNIHQSWEKSSFFPTKNLGHSLQGRAVYKAILAFLNDE